ncbi:flavin reductase family protein [Bradyrhizobium sp. WSM3983]|uniref:flavin reductase family protein n=1 Tax=Bradyrhizobium sp. WSM3983 TaxID=1038867 RepID=UPI0004036BC2|nr:flavin reductase family protein [Bradyrhizobium sp. WSM3983]
MPTSFPAIEPKAFWRVLGMRAIGGAVVTARGPDGDAGFLALSVTHLTQNPPTLMLSIGKSTSALAAVRAAGHFAVNYLPSSLSELADVFGGRTGLKGPDRFVDGQWDQLLTGAPILKDAVGAIECRVAEEIERYDSVIVIGEIVNWTFNEGLRPLIYFSGKTFD